MTSLSRSRSILALVLALLALVTPRVSHAQAPCQKLGAGEDVLTRARAERRILNNLSLLAALSSSERTRGIETVEAYLAREDPDGRIYDRYDDGVPGMPSITLGVLHRGMNHEGFRLCAANGSVKRATLERNWWGFYEHLGATLPDERYRDVALFYLRSTDGVEFNQRGRNPSLDYAQNLLGMRLGGDRLSLTLGLFVEKFPEASDISTELVSPRAYESLSIDRARERSLYLNLGIPKLGVSFDLLGLPGSRRGGVDLAQLGVGGVRLPAGARLDAVLGYLGGSKNAFGAIRVDEIPGGFDVEVGGEASASVFKYARVSWRPMIRFETALTPREDDPYPYRRRPPEFAYITLSPFISASITRDEHFLQYFGTRDLVGGQVGAEVRLEQPYVSLGFKAHVGRDLSDWLIVLPETAGHVTWGTTAFLYFGM